MSSTPLPRTSHHAGVVQVGPPPPSELQVTGEPSAAEPLLLVRSMLADDLERFRGSSHPSAVGALLSAPRQFASRRRRLRMLQAPGALCLVAEVVDGNHVHAAGCLIASVDRSGLEDHGRRPRLDEQLRLWTGATTQRPHRSLPRWVRANLGGPLGRLTNLPTSAGLGRVVNSPAPQPPPEHPVAAVLSLLAVAPAWQQRGVGSALLEAFEARAASLGARQAELTTPYAAACQTFFHRRGWTPTIVRLVPGVGFDAPMVTTLQPDGEDRVESVLPEAPPTGPNTTSTAPSAHLNEVG